MNSSYFSKADFITNNSDNFSQNKYINNNQGEKLVFDNNDKFHKVKFNYEVNLGNLKVPDLDEKSCLVKQINKTKDIIDHYDKFFKEIEIDGRYSKTKIIKEQVTLENFNKNIKNAKSKIEKTKKISQLLKHHLPSLKSNYYNDKSNFNYKPSITEEPKNYHDVYKMYYIKKINLHNYKKLFNIGNGEDKFIDNINYLETLPDKNINVNPAKTNSFSDYAVTSNLFDENNGKFFNRNLAYGNDDSAFMAKLMLKIELKKLNNENSKKRSYNFKTHKKPNCDNSTVSKSEISNICLNKQTLSNLNKNNKKNLNDHSDKSSICNSERNKDKVFIRNLNISKLNNSFDISINDNSKIRNNYYYEKYARDEIKEIYDKKVSLPKIESIYYQEAKQANKKSSKIDNMNIFCKNEIVIEEVGRKKEDLKFSKITNIINVKGLSRRKNKLISENSLQTFNTDINDHSRFFRNYLNSTKFSDKDSFSSRYFLKNEYNNNIEKNKISNNNYKQEEIWSFNENLKNINLSKMISNNACNKNLILNN